MNMEMIEAASARIGDHARPTPLLSSPFLDAEAGRPVHVKAETLQHTGSFKIRGAWSAISALDPPERAAGVIAFSSGNHAQGVARAAALHGVPAVIVMPSDAPRIKIENTRALGAEVVAYDRATQDRDAIGAALAEERGLSLIKPFDAPEVIAGQGTAGLEIAEQAAAAGVDEAEVLVCGGGGGLTAGIALALEARAPGMRVRPVEPEGYDDIAQSQAQGRIVALPVRSGGLCDSIVTPAPGELTFPVIARLCAPAQVVTEDEALAAMALAFRHLKIVLEPGGAVALAAALWHGGESTAPVVAVATGGNVDPAVFARALRHAGPPEAPA